MKRTSVKTRLIRFLIAVLIAWGGYTVYFVWTAFTTWQRAAALYQAGKYAESIPEFRRHNQLIEDDPEAHYWLANALGLTGDIAAAIVEFRRAVELEAKNAEYHSALANALWMQKQYPESERSYAEAIALDPFNPEIHNDLAFLYIRQRKKREARVELERALKIDPGNEKAILGLEILAGKRPPPGDTVPWRSRRQLDRT